MTKFIPSRQFKSSQTEKEERQDFDEERQKFLFGFLIFLLSESLIFVSLMVAYVSLRLLTDDWLPPDVQGPQFSTLTMINSIVLLSSSVVIYTAEWFLKRRNLTLFRLLWLMTSVMGMYFFWGQVQEWQNLDFGWNAGTLGGTFYALTGFHALHVAVGILLQIIMLGRSLIPDNYQGGYYGVTAVSWFWHFVDGIWIILLGLLYLW